jgi:hypothetical protein
MTISYLRLPQPGGPGPCIYIPQEQVAQLYSRALGSLFVTSYDSQGYGGGIQYRLHTGLKLLQVQIILRPILTSFGPHRNRLPAAA